MAKVDFTIPVDLVIRITDIDEDEIERSKADFDEYLLHENGTEHRYSGTAFMVYLNLID